MRLAFSADLHGNITRYAALLRLAQEQSCAALLVGGDLLPHTARRDSALDIQRRFIREQLAPLLAQLKASSPAIAVYLLPGNDDWLAAIGDLDALESQGLAFPLHNRVYQLAPGLFLAGYACVPLTPFSIKDYERADESPPPAAHSFAMAFESSSGAILPLDAASFAARPTIAEELAALAQQSEPARTIHAVHAAPPANCALDLASRNRHLGSQAIRRFIERERPPLTLHGHIHEAPRLSGRFAERLGPTICAAAGQEAAPDNRLFALVFDTDDIAATMRHTVFGNAQLATPPLALNAL